jgi:predicted transcriptional regulator
MLKQGMTMQDIGNIMGISQQAVSQTKIRYGLPRSDEEITGVNQEK